MHGAQVGEGAFAVRETQQAGRQLPLLSMLVPLWVIAMMDGWRVALDGGADERAGICDAAESLTSDNSLVVNR